MRFISFLIAGFVVPVCILLHAVSARAQEYEPIHAAGFLISPKLELEQQYDDNIFASEDEAESDLITISRPGLKIQKNYRDHEFILDNNLELMRYWENSDESQINYKSEFSGRLVAKRALTLPFKISYEADHKDRHYERDLSSAREPIGFKQLKTEIGGEYKPGRLQLGLYGGYNEYRYDNSESFAGVPLVYDDGDYDSLYGRTEIKYTTGTEWTPFFNLLLADNDYLRKIYTGGGYNGADRDNRLLRAQVGAEFDYHDIWRGRAAVGHDWRKYEEDGVDDVTALSAGGNVRWKPTLKTELMLDFLRQTEEDNLVNDGTVETNMRFGINYEFRRDMFFTVAAEWAGTQFENSDRTDDVYGGSIGLRYVLNKKMEIGGEYLHRFRESSDDGSDFKNNVFMLRLITKL